MPDIKIKSEHVKTYIAFGKEAKKLGEKSQSELRDLAIIAQESNDPSLLDLFEGELPSAADLKAARTEDQKKKEAPAVVKPTVAAPAK